MNRITKVATITATALAALIATGGAASASVNVDANGVGHVDKGDVQSALGFNDGALQSAWKDGKIKFTASVDRVIADYEMSCGPANTGATMHKVITQPAQMVVEAKANTNKAGKVTSGWDLTGKLTGEVISVGNATMVETACPEGSFPWMPVGAPRQYVKGITGDLKVNGVALPNTPVG